jgi:tRNA1(Val) A37 N6-methylase TrmN6
MEHLHGGFTLHIPEHVFPLSTDSMILADFVGLKRNDRVLDLGSGCGTLGTLLCANDPGCTVTGIEIDPCAHEAATENIRRNALSHRLSSICGDLRQIPELISQGSFSCCVSNPPYFSGGPASLSVPNARRIDCCTSEDLFRAASYALRWGGDFYLVHRPEMLAHLCGCACTNHLEPKRLRLVRHRAGSAPALILLQCRKGGKPGLILDEICLHDHSGNPTGDYRRIYHLDEPTIGG